MKNNIRFGMVLVFSVLVMSGSATLVMAQTLTRELQVGSTGSDVSALQSFLAVDPSLYPQGLVTGYFGSLTKGAVANFQVRNGISAVGRVGPITLVALNAQMSGGGNTTGYDRAAPSLSPVSVSVSGSSATLSWTTGENAAAVVYYSTSPLSMLEAGNGSSVTVSGTSVLVHTDLRTTHSVTISGLSTNTTYYYVVLVKDGSGNESVTWPTTFRTTN